jgi:hypothetical protein
MSGKTIPSSTGPPLSKPDEEYVQISRLGKGNEGYVYLCRKEVCFFKIKKKKNGELFAMKKIEIDGEETVKKDTMVF